MWWINMASMITWPPTTKPFQTFHFQTYWQPLDKKRSKLCLHKSFSPLKKIDLPIYQLVRSFAKFTIHNRNVTWSFFRSNGLGNVFLFFFSPLISNRNYIPQAFWEAGSGFVMWQDSYVIYFVGDGCASSKENYHILSWERKARWVCILQ